MVELKRQFVPSWALTPRRAKSKPWFTKSLYRLTQKRQKCYQIFRMVPTDENKRKLRDITCEMKVAIRMAKDSYSGTMHSTLQQNPKEFWRRVKRNSRNKVAIPSLVIGDDIVNGDTEKAESFNQYFCSVFTPVIRNNESRQVRRSGIGEMDSINFPHVALKCCCRG